MAEELERLLGEMEEGEVERGLAFRLDPTRVRQALSTLVRETPQLWLLHLLQLFHEMEMASPPRMQFVGNGVVHIEFAPADPGLEAMLDPEKVFEREGLVLEGDAPSTMARILCEVGHGTLYSRAGTGYCLLSEPDRFRLLPADQVRLEGYAGRRARGLSLHLPGAALHTTNIAPLFGFGPGTARQLLNSLAGVNVNRPTTERNRTAMADWPFRPDDATAVLAWDWESVRPAGPEQTGFEWLVGSGGERLSEDSQATIVWNSHCIDRSWTQLPVLASYPPGTPHGSPNDIGTRRIRATAVMGLATCATASLAQGSLIPISRGVPIFPKLDLPKGLYVLADASRLRCDASGVHLVQDEAYRRWSDELVIWMGEQIRLYLPLLPSIGGHSARRRQAKGGFLKGVLRALEMVAPLQGNAAQIAHRTAELEKLLRVTGRGPGAWAENRD